MSKKNILISIFVPVLTAGFVLLLLFLCTMSVVKLNFVDESGNVFKEKTVVRSIYNMTLDAEELVGYNFESWEGVEGESFELDGYGSHEFDIHYETDALTMPIIKITTEDHRAINSKEDYTNCTVSVMNTEEEYAFSDTVAGIRLRGNSTLLGDKKPYRIKFDKKQGMLGLNNGNEYKSWVLLAEWYDYSLSRNSLNFYIGSQLDFYCSDFAYVEMFLNGDYQGVYLLCEQQQINEGRIDIEEYEEGVTQELDTGYLLENDYYYYESEDYWIENNVNGKVEDVYHWLIKSDTTKPEQMEYIQAYMQRVYDALYGDATREEIEALLDVSSAVDMTILQLINCNTDANSSFYVFKDAGGVLFFGAPWDGDMCFANLRHATFPGGGIILNHLLQKLYEREWFFELVKQRWSELSYLETATQEFLQNIVTTYEAEFERNFSIYNQLGRSNFFAHVDEVATFKSQKDASQYLQNWLANRFEYLNTLLA